MTIAIDTPPRVFQLGSVELQDPDPSLSPAEAVALYAPNFPQARNATLEGPEVRGDGTLVYTIRREPVKTKG